MVENIESEGEALMAGGHQPLDAEALMLIVAAAEEAGRDSGLEPEEYLCPVHLEQPDGRIKRLLSTDEVSGLYGFWDRNVRRMFSGQIKIQNTEDPIADVVNRPSAREFVEKGRDWLQECVDKRRPVFVRAIKIGQIAVSPHWTQE